jgi:PAS domain S-box-containing protein
MQDKPRESNENNFMALLNFIVDPAVIIDEKGHILLVNIALENLTGFSKKELIGKSFFELSNLTAESKAIMLEKLRKRMQGLSVEPYEITFTDKTGETRYAEVKAKKIDYAGQPADLVIFRDITRRKQNAKRLKEYAEKMEALVNEKVKEVKESAQKLSESEEKYRTQFEEALDAIFLADAETGIIIDCNRAASELVGREKSELVGKHQWILHPPEEIEGEFSRTFKQHLEEKEGQVLETQVITKRGEIKDVAIKANVIELRGKKLIQGVFRDITERKQMEEKMTYERGLFNVLMDNMPDPIYFKDTKSRFIRVNRASCPGLGIKDPEEAIGMTDFDFAPEELAKQFYADDQMVMKSSKPIIGKEEVMIDKISRKWYSATKVPIKDKNNKVLGLVGISRNITKLKEAEEELKLHSDHLEELVEQKTKQLKQAERMAAIGELAGMVGHDLRNPLTGIKGAIYYLKTKYGAEIDVSGKEMLETIDKAIDHSNKIINDLLDYSRDLTLELGNTTPKLLLKNALSLIEVPERIQIIDATKDKPEIKVDREKMNRAFVNIITNAIDAMPETGTLTVTNKAVKGNVKIAFKDTGTGMSEETLSKLKLWSPLFTTKAKGMGFGLPVCKRIVEAHGGKISVESTLGKGTTVTITIPVNPQPVDEGEEKWIFNESWLSATPTA